MVFGVSHHNTPIGTYTFGQFHYEKTFIYLAKPHYYLEVYSLYEFVKNI